MIKLVILGVTGSIGKQVLQVVRENRDTFEIVGISVNTSIEQLDSIINEFKSIKMIGIANHEVCQKYQNKDVIITSNLLKLLQIKDINMVVNAVVGISGLPLTFEAIKLNLDIALANKESIVCGGDVLQNLLKKSTSKIYPIDSEHSAIAQCLIGEKKENIRNLIITASGGPFRDKDLAYLNCVTKNEALNHPNWDMGDKITIDSATLVNKGLEIIEAHYLFDIPYSKIKAVIHYESIIHSMVEWIDGSIKAQLGVPSMEIPIQYALYKNEHVDKENQNFDFAKAFSMHFKPIDLNRFEAVKIAYEVGNKGGSSPLIYSSANEAAVNLFLNDLIGFNDIIRLIKKSIEEFANEVVNSLDDILSLDLKVRNFVKNNI